MRHETRRWRTWLARLADPRCPPSQRREAETCAYDWPTCAIGEHRQRLEARGERFTDGGAPCSPALHELGLAFAESVCQEDYVVAMRVLDSLEKWLDESGSTGQKGAEE